jgi:hypothetical protein
MMPIAMAPAKAVKEMDSVDRKPNQKSGKLSHTTRKFRFDSIQHPWFSSGTMSLGPAPWQQRRPVLISDA